MNQTVPIVQDNVDFENINLKFENVRSSPSYLEFCKVLSAKSHVFVIGNGGLHYVAGHMACDISRLVPGKAVHSFDSVGFITSNANDYGYSQLFVRWLETIILPIDFSNCMIIGLSCSGRSENILNALDWGNSNNIPSWMISGSYDHPHHQTITLNCKYYHTVEALILMLFYDMIHKIGYKCPSIESNYADSALRSNPGSLS